MMHRSRSPLSRRTALLLLAVWGGGAAQADTVLLKSGRTLEISGYRVEGGRIVLVTEGGGEVALPREQVLEIRRVPAREPPPTPEALPEPPPPFGIVAPSTPPEEPASKAPAAPAARLGRDEIRDLARRTARRHQVDEALVLAVLEVESQYDPRARSPRGASGLMQLMPQTAARFAVSDPFDPAENLDGGVRYLKELLARYSGQVRLALAAYNAGEEAVERWSGIPPYRETIHYVERVGRLLVR